MTAWDMWFARMEDEYEAKRDVAPSPTPRDERKASARALFRQGKHQSEIAWELGMSVDAVTWMVRDIMRPWRPYGGHVAKGVILRRSL